MNLLFSNKVSPEFLSKVKDISYSLGIDPNYLMFIISYETSNSFSPSIKNDINAVGLIQFLPSTAQDLGTSTDELEAMSAVNQLDYVQAYLKPYKGEMVDLATTYLAVFFPKAIGQPDTYRFPDNVVSSNPSFFKHGNTLGDFKKAIADIVYARVPSDYYDVLLKKKEIFCKFIKERSLSEFYS